MVEPAVASVGYIMTGSTMLNLALSDDPFGGYMRGTIVNIVGDKKSGKSILCHTGLATAAIDPALAKYQLVNDDIESASSFDVEYMFGQALVDRMMAPHLDEDDFPIASETIQDLDAGVHDWFSPIDSPAIYVADSFDGLTSDEELERQVKATKAKKKGRKVAGTYALETTKGLSALLRKMKVKVRDQNGLLIIVSQVRENMDAIAFGKKYRRNGGRALGHWCSQEMWLYGIGAIMRDRKGKKHEIGNKVKVKVEKNRATGKRRTIEFDIFYDYGIDDIGSCVDFMLENEFWKKGKSGINAVGLGRAKDRANLCKRIEDNQREKKLGELCGEAWGKIEEDLRLNRKRRFHDGASATSVK